MKRSTRPFFGHLDRKGHSRPVLCDIKFDEPILVKGLVMISEMRVQTGERNLEGRSKT